MSSPIPNSPSSAPSGSAKCPHCGRALSPNAPLGACPHCLLAAGIASEPAAPANSAPPPTPDELAPDFPQLDILELLGRGGMGAVYKARQKSLDRLVALKLLRPGLDADPSFADRFTREARALAQLNHPGIVTLYEFGRTESGRFFILMEFVDGLNLRQLLAAGRLSPREALAIVPPLCDALQYAHDRGLIHRDIKPENLLIDRLGRVKIADFGLAKLTATSAGRDGSPSPSETPAPALTSDTGHWSLVTGHSASDETAAGVLFGTPGYMAPEQRAHPSAVDHRADIYALGVVLYQLLTGELPDAQQLQAPSQRVHLDIRLDAIVLRALEKNPALRYSAATELKTHLETIANSSPPPPPPPTAPASQSASPAIVPPNPVNPLNPVQKTSAPPPHRISAIPRRPLKHRLLRIATFTALAIVTIFLLRAFVIAPYRIKGSSVEPEIPAGSLAFVYKLQRHFAPGDIVAYRHSESLTYVARVATAGPVNDQLFVTRKDQPPISVATSSIIGSVVFNTRNSRPRTSPPHDEKTKITPPSTPATRSSPSVESAAPRLDTLSQLPEPDPASITWTTTPDRTAEQPLLRIHASPGTDYKKIVALMDALKKSDFNRIAFDTLPEPQSQLPARAIPLPSETRQEILRLKIAEAKKLVSLAKTRVEAGVTTNEELHAAQDTVTILEAELLGDQSKIAQTKIAAAKRRFAVVSERHKIGNAWNDELHAAKDELALLEAELAHDPLKIAQIKVAAAKRRLDEATTRVETGTATDEVLSKAKTELAIRQLELNELLKTQPAK